MLAFWYGGSMCYYVYDGSGLSAVCSSVLSFCLHACKLWYDVSKYQHNLNKHTNA